jgi:hypothetical protein
MAEITRGWNNMLIVDGFPRRNRVDLYTPMERAVSDAIQAVEASFAHPRMTDAVSLLGKAMDAVADAVEDEGNTYAREALERVIEPPAQATRKPVHVCQRSDVDDPAMWEDMLSEKFQAQPAPVSPVRDGTTRELTITVEQRELLLALSPIRKIGKPEYAALARHLAQLNARIAQLTEEMAQAKAEITRLNNYIEGALT